MKKLLILSITAVAIMANLSSCKKGENDPFLSMKSRKARVAGEWTVTGEEVTSTDVNYSSGGGVTFTTTTTSSSTFNGTTKTTTSSSVTTSSSGGNPVTSSSTNTSIYTLGFTFEKDGTFKMDKVNTSPSYTEAYEGNWSFVGKSKSVELKNKEAIVLTFTKYSYTSGGVTTTDSATGFDQPMILVMDQLKSKEIIFINESSYTDSDGDNGTSKTVTTLTAK